MINTYATIDRLFGTPLSGVPQPKMPFKLKGWHLVLGVAVLGLTTYGAYCARRDWLERNKRSNS